MTNDFLILGHMRAMRTMFSVCLNLFGQMYMKWTYFIIGINDYILLLHWEDFVLLLHANS